MLRPKCQTLSQVIEELYMNLSVAPEMEKLNQEVKEVDEKSVCVITILITLYLDASRFAMQ